jgi:hypothetical protein
MGYPYEQRGQLIETILVAALYLKPKIDNGYLIDVAKDSKNYREYARLQLSETQWKCLDELWERESSWQTKRNPHLIANRSSRAYGIPQALPGNKMKEAGLDWRTNPITQVKWGLKYIQERYGNACTALRHHNAKNWY